MNQEKDAKEKSTERTCSEFKIHQDIIHPVFSLRPTCSNLSFQLESIFTNGPEGIRREFESFSQASPNSHRAMSVSLDTKEKKMTKGDSEKADFNSVQEPRQLMTDFVENSLLYQIFRTDFLQILDFCLYPDLRPLTYYQEHVQQHSFLLIEMIKKCRVNKLKTEQKIKKIINHAYDLMKRQYLSSRYKNLGHISDAHKKEVFVYYFNKEKVDPEEFIRQMGEQPLWRSADKFNLAYNKRFFNYIRECPLFLKDLRKVIDELESKAVDTIKNDLRLFMKDVVRFAYQNSIQPIKSFLPSEKLIVDFFNTKVQKELNKKGIKFPWTESQYKHSIQILRSYISSGSEKDNEDSNETAE